MALHYVPDMGCIYVPEETPDDTSPRGMLAYARGVVATAVTLAEDYLVEHGYPPLELATLDLYSRAVIGWWREDVGGTGPDYPDTNLVVYVNVALPPAEPDLPPPPPEVTPVDPDPIVPGPPDDDGQPDDDPGRGRPPQ